jgi:hypothetical protein
MHVWVINIKIICDNTSAGMARSRFLHWLPWRGKNYSPYGIIMSTCCFAPDWSFHEEHQQGM